MKVRYLLFAIIIPLLVLPGKLKAVSSGDVLGQVIDIDTHQPIPYATVTFENYYDKVTVTANEHGYYYGFHIPEGRYHMRVVYNERTFVMNRVKVYDSYSCEVNFFVSCSDTLPQIVLETTPKPVINPFQPNDILLTHNGMGNASIPLSDLLMAQPAVDIFQGRLYVKGAPVKFYVDGSPVMVPATFNK
jgi:hypothetical protein